MIKEFQPHVIFVSAGFDGLRGDPLGQCAVTQDAMTYLADGLKSLSPNGKIIAALEGGYNTKVTSRAVDAVIRVSLEIRVFFDYLGFFGRRHSNQGFKDQKN